MRGNWDSCDSSGSGSNLRWVDDLSELLSYLPLDWDVLSSSDGLLDWGGGHSDFRDDLRDILLDVLHSHVLSVHDFSWDGLSPSPLLVVSDGSLSGDNLRVFSGLIISDCSGVRDSLDS